MNLTLTFAVVCLTLQPANTSLNQRTWCRLEIRMRRHRNAGFGKWKETSALAMSRVSFWNNSINIFFLEILQNRDIDTYTFIMILHHLLSRILNYRGSFPFFWDSILAHRSSVINTQILACVCLYKHVISVTWNYNKSNPVLIPQSAENLGNYKSPWSNQFFQTEEWLYTNSQSNLNFPFYPSHWSKVVGINKFPKILAYF